MRMNDELTLERVKVDCHGGISGKVRADDDAYDILLAEMQDHFANDQMVSVISYNPRVGELCAGVWQNCWYRVKVVNKLSGGRTGYIVTCNFVDEGLEKAIPVSGLKHLPPKFSELPFQVKNVHLHGIQPYSMKISPEDLNVYQGPKRLWDEAAVKYIDDNITAATEVRCTVMETYADGTLSVRMYLGIRRGELICLNELLMTKNYATGTDRPEERKRVSPETSESLTTTNIQRVFRKRHHSNKQNTSEMTVKSDTEYSSRTSIPYDRGDFSDEVDYFTDNQGISAISHRRFHRTPPKTLTDIYQENELKKLEITKNCGGLNGYTNNHVDREHNGDAEERVKTVQEEKRLSLGRGQLYNPANDKDTHSDCASDRQRMRGVRGSYSSGDENVRHRIDQRRQIILNQYYGQDVENDSLLSDSLGARPKTTTPPKETRANENGYLLFKGRGSPSYGRGAVFTSDLTDRLKSPPSASVCSDTSSNDLLPKGRGAILLNQFSSQYTMQTDSRSQCETRENSDNESTFGIRSRRESLSSKIRSISDMDSCTESETGALSRNERRRQAKLSSVNNDIYSDSNQSEISKTKKFVQSSRDDAVSKTSKSLIGNTGRASSLQTSHRKSPYAYSSGNESATSEVSIVAASMRGQGEFKGSRLPRGTSTKRNPDGRLDSSDSSSRIQHTQAAASSCPVNQQQPRIPSTTDLIGSSSSVVNQYQTRQSLTPDLTGSGASSDERFIQKVTSPSKLQMLVSDISVKNVENQSTRNMLGQLPQSVPNDGGMAAKRFENGSAQTAVFTGAKSKMIGEMAGKRMLTNLTQSSTRGLARTTTQESGFATLCYEVLVHGSRPPKPVYKLQNARFTEHVEMAFGARRFHELKLSQAYAWPAITRGQHVITISPPGGGKTLAYLCPLISALSDARVYHQVNRNGKGPFVIVLSFTWRRAKYVYSEARSLIGGRRDMKVILVHGGAQLEEQKACELINGCEILVATPPGLTRILEAGYTDLRRLCHLVVDDADQTLKNFSRDIGNLIKNYDLVIKNEMKHLGCPRQILCFGAQWNAATNGFMLSNLNEPVLIITSPFEAAIYGQVKQVTHMCKKAERLREVLGILENLPDDSCHPVIIFASDTRDIVMLYKTLNTNSRFCLMVHEDMDTFEVDRIAEQWPVPLLVCWDEHTAKLRITNATAVIHYDMPPSKTKFSNRLCCMRQYFHDFSKSEQSSIKPTSHMIITEDCERQLRSLNDLLIRLDCERPAELKLFMAGLLEHREEDEGRELCTQTLAFGTCRDTTRCSCRHRIIPACDNMADSDWIPSEGEVKVLLTHVQDASHYYVRLLGVKHEGKTVYEDLSLRFTQMQMDLAMWYSNLRHKKRYAPDITEESGYAIGEVCGYEENEVFYRVQIFSIEKSLENEAVPVINVLVKFVDSGRMKTIPAYKLYVLPSHLRDLAFQAVEVFVCKVRPVDKDIEWTQKANMFISEAVSGKELVGNVLLRIGYILWLDPLLSRKYLPLTHTVSHQFYVHEELTRNGFADENKNHLLKLYKLCEGKINIPKALLKKTKMSPILDTDVLPACASRKSHDVHVSSVLSPDLFFVQRKEKLEELEDLMTEINLFVDKNDIYVDIGQELTRGKYCLAQYTNFDQRWYRGQILEVAANQFKVFFADYGDSDYVPKDKVREIPVDRFHELPLQAIECKLYGIRPIDEEWSETVGNVLWDLTHYVNFDLRVLNAVVKGMEPARYAGRNKFIVELGTISRSCDLNIAQELSWQQLAVLAEGSEMEPLFPKPSRLRTKMYRCLVDKVPDLCSSLYWETDEERALKICEEIYGLISTSLNSSGNSSVLQCVACLVKLLGHIKWDSVHENILFCILHFAQVGEMICDELIDMNCVPSLIRCLEMNSNPVLQQQAADFIAKISDISSRIKTYFQLKGNIQVLFELLSSTESDLVQGAVCRAFAALCKGSEGVYTYLMDKSVCQKLVKCLTHTAEHHVAEGILTLIAVLAEHDSGHEDLKKESLIEAIVKNLSKTNCDKCIQYSVQQCDYFSSTRRKHKTFLLEQQMVPILTRILQLDLQSATKQLCKDLLTSLVIKVPSEPLSGTAFRHDNLTTASDSIPPEVKWSQNTFRVVLKVTVNNVTGSPKQIVNFTNNSVKFRATVDGLCYAFKYKLFDSIIVEKSTVEIGTNVVAISMKKSKEGKWSRLLHDKVKPSNLFVDFENWVDSSSDSEVCDDEQPFVLKKKQRGAKGFRSGGKPPERRELADRESDTSTSDSLENEEDRDDPLYENFL